MLESPAVKLGAFAVVLGLALAGGLAVGAAVGPEPSTSDDTSGHDAAHDVGAAQAASDEPAGLAVSSGGYTLDLRTPVVDATDGADLELVIEGPDGRPVTDFTIEHDKELHLVIVSRDLAGSRPPPPDTRRRRPLDRDHAAVGSPARIGCSPTSSRPAATASPWAPISPSPATTGRRPCRHRANQTHVDGFDVSFDGELIAGTESELTVTVTRDGRPVTDLQPYLGALGHLVAIRDGDLAYLHVHPLDETAGSGGPRVRFAVEVPTAGTYGLYFDFSHRDEVRTATIIAAAETAPRTRPPRRTSGEPDSHGG